LGYWALDVKSLRKSVKMENYFILTKITDRNIVATQSKILTTLLSLNF
jgi:hypothetical protein